MIIRLHPNFKKSYKNRIVSNPKLAAKTEERIKLFQADSSSQILKDHSLKGARKNFRAFSITGDIRIIYSPATKDLVIFLDIGTHNQVY